MSEYDFALVKDIPSS